MTAASQGSDSPWFLGYIQGVVAIALGAFALLSDTGASYLLGVIIAIYLLIAGLIQLVRGWEVRSKTGDELGRGILPGVDGTGNKYLWLGTGDVSVGQAQDHHVVST